MLGEDEDYYDDTDSDDSDFCFFYYFDMGEEIEEVIHEG